MDNHKRSKSQIAKSLLSRVSSKSDGAREDGSGDDSASSLASQSTHGKLQKSSSHRLSRRQMHLTTTVNQKAPPSDTSAGHSPLAQSPPQQMASAEQPASTSLEQSVKLFRMFEALRSGDTTTVEKAMKEQTNHDDQGRVEGTTTLHLAIQCAEMPVIEYVLSAKDSGTTVNARDKDGNTPLHIAARLSRAPVVKLLLERQGINDSAQNYSGQTALDLAVAPDVFQQLQLARSLRIDENVRKIHELVASRDYDQLEKLLTDDRIKATIDIDGEELPTDEATTQSGGTLLHEAARKKDHKLIQLLLLNGADPFKRDRKGHLPQNVTKDDRTKAILKKSPAAAAAQRGIQEKTILGGAASSGHNVATGDASLSNKDSRETKGYLKKWTNYTSGWKLRWFVLEDGVLSYYKNQGTHGSRLSVLHN